MTEKITIAEIEAFEAEKDRIEEGLKAFACEVREARTGKPVEWPWKYDSYERCDGWIDVNFYVDRQGGDDYMHVRFPENYLSLMNWRQVEADQKLAKEAAGIVGKLALTVRQAIDRDERDRRDFARLQAKFGAS